MTLVCVFQKARTVTVLLTAIFYAQHICVCVKRRKGHWPLSGVCLCQGAEGLVDAECNKAGTCFMIMSGLILWEFPV